MQPLSYNEAIEWLFQQFPSYQNIGGKAYKPGLDNILSLLNHFGNPHHELKFVHVAGTNGKGSTSSMLASILTESGQTVGLFTSPHIQDFRERIRVNGNVIPEQEVIDFIATIQSISLGFEPSFFEITFLMALMHFKSKNCSICVIETGLGGRLDATNCITPLLSLITNISLEHTQFLGNSVEEIAFEKGGIIKENIPVIIGEREEKTAAIFTEIANAKHSTISFASDLTIEAPQNFPLLGAYQLSNYKLVKRALEVLQDTFPITAQQIQQGLENLSANTGFFGRLQKVQSNPTIIFDVSHNEAGIMATLQSFPSWQRLIIIYGTSSDKDLGAIFQHFGKQHTYLMTEFSSERSAKMDDLKAFAEKFALRADFFQNPLEALDTAKSIANKEDTILVMGSFFLISDFFKKK